MKDFNVKSVWLMGIPAEEQQSFKDTLSGSSVALDQLTKILIAKYETVQRKGFREEDYDSSDWTHKQAFNNGRLSILQEIIDLLDFKPRNGE